MSDNSKENLTDLKLDDSAIAQIAKVLQMAILSGTDIVDNLRLMRLTSEDGKLILSENYVEKFEEDIEHMVDSVSEDAPNLLSGGVFDGGQQVPDNWFPDVPSLNPKKDETN